MRRGTDGPDGGWTRASETWAAFVARARWPWATPALALLVAWAHTQSYASYAAHPAEACTARGVTRTLGHAFRSIYTHADGEHLASNLVALLAHGLLLEALHGAGRTLAIFHASGIFGVLVWHDALPDRARHTYRGASAAVYGVIAALAAHVVINWRETPLRWLWVLAVGLTLAMDAYALYLDDPTSHVAHEAHLGGAATGLSLGLGLLRNYAVARWERILAALGAVGVGTVSVVTSMRLLQCDWRREGE